MTMWVAGPGALIVAKVHKIADRVDDRARSSDKDALDVLRLLRAVATDDVAARVRRLVGDDLSQAVAIEAVDLLPVLFGSLISSGVAMAVRAASGAEPDTVVASSLVALASDLRQRLV